MNRAPLISITTQWKDCKQEPEPEPIPGPDLPSFVQTAAVMRPISNAIPSVSINDENILEHTKGYDLDLGDSSHAKDSVSQLDCDCQVLYL